MNLDSAADYSARQRIRIQLCVLRVLCGQLQSADPVPEAVVNQTRVGPFCCGDEKGPLSEPLCGPGDGF